ncbi:fasciclin domain-containing protein [Aspergillus homomorphus CBS 101889]|uniref:FAS1 domain-containing protein n=1 Tax=Aspergillus homomorphus (strain CBS 101889) TaxID=1450537 RepID=A0A395IC33_ASPHC|nr:FAS1 domain-containing protein [Aspergillus homomorphus CBS 101889]RAL15724.1 FAS1 domain-containing protein [Aspergillus homomorphus CBS 101889]
MKHFQIWALAALPLTSAFLIPPKQQTILHEPKQQTELEETHRSFDALRTLVSALNSPPPVEQITTWFDELEDGWVPEKVSQLPPPFRRPSPPPHPHHPPSNKSLYDLISDNPHTTILAQIVKDDEHLVHLLNCTSAKLTFFAPTDEAFAKIPHHRHRHHHHDDDDEDDNEDGGGDHEKPPPELIRAVIKYHLVSSIYTPAELFHAHTLPTLLTEPLLSPEADADSRDANPNEDNGEGEKLLPQRLHIHASWKGLTLNLYSRIIAADKHAANGLLYTIDSILVPPPSALTVLTIVPSKFSTFVLALHQTGLAEWFNHSHSHPHSPNINPKGEVRGRGGTYLPPTNRAFASLGLKANAFLFSPCGTPYLRALLKYHLVPHRTLYSDTVYTHQGRIEKIGPGLHHFDVPTLLEGHDLAVDVANLGPWAGVTAAGVEVAVADLPVRDGVLHVLSRGVLVPRCHRGKEGKGEKGGEGEMEVEELKGRLRGLVDLEMDLGLEGGVGLDEEDTEGQGDAGAVWGKLHDLLEL